jgi:hypothetical protein
MRISRIVISSLFVLLVGLTVFGGQAYADYTCSPTCTIDLKNPNVSNIGPIDIRVVIDNSGANTTISVQWISGGPGTPDRIDSFGIVTQVTVSSVSYNGSDVSSLWSAQPNQNIDGFGTFSVQENGPPPPGSDVEGILHPIIFTLSGKVTTFSLNPAPNSTGFVAHVGGYSSGCSAWVGDGTSTGTSSDSKCTPTSVPETSSLPLLGIALLGVGFVWRKMSKVVGAAS